ncbi:MAG: hypothetical protein J0L61_02015 [Planctomycetes bacterium]|nr:hypothetical protein [Planctomycetota bacterium]
MTPFLAQAASGVSQVRLLLGVVVVLVLLLGLLIVVTLMRRSVRIRRELAERQRRGESRISPWQAAGQRARPIPDDDPDKTRPM